MKVLFCLVCLLGLAQTSCTSPGKKTAFGAGIGAAAGAAVGAIIGHQTGNRSGGALIGAAAGGMLGGAVGNRMDKQAKELAAVAKTRRTEEGIVTELKGDILFPTGASNLKQQASGRINVISNILKKYPENRIIVIGHTDSVGSSQSNQALSLQRAESVRSQMISSGIAGSSVSVVGRGEAQPIGNNKTKMGRAKNRRVEIQISQAQTATTKK